MSTTWAPLTAYLADAVVAPTAPNGHTYRCTTAGSSGASEPAWPGSYATVADGSAKWNVYTVITPQQVRDYMGIEPVSASTEARYLDPAVGQEILESISTLEKATHRYFVNRPGFTWTDTSMLRAQMPIPGLRAAASVSWGGSVQSPGSGYWLIPDAQQSGVYCGLQTRPWRGDPSAGPSYLHYHNPSWFDLAADSPFFPPNYGGGYVYTSMPDDLVVTGDWGHAESFEPGDFTRALRVLSAFSMMRPASILVDSAITAQGGVLTYSDMPAEVRQFIREWGAGQVMASVGP